jgi:chitinase
VLFLTFISICGHYSSVDDAQNKKIVEELPRESFFKKIKNWFRNLDIFIKLYIATMFLIILAIPIMVTQRTNLSSRADTTSATPSTGKVVFGYLTWANWSGVLSNLKSGPLDYVTYVDGPTVKISSASIPALEGTWGDVNTACNQIVPAVHGAGKKALFYLYTGGDVSVNLQAVTSANTIGTLVKNISSLIKNCGYDGVSLDIEDNSSTAQKRQLLSALRAQLNSDFPDHKIISMAGPGLYNTVYYDDFVPTVADFSYLDFYEIMSYDMWDTANQSPRGYPHAPYATVEAGLNSWISAGYPKEKLILGIPFYGYCYYADGTNSDGSTKYNVRGCESNQHNYWSYIADNFSSAPSSQDSFTVDGHSFWINNIDTVKKKTQLALNKNIGGVMIFALNYDKLNNSRSLLSAIHDTLGNSASTPVTVVPTAIPTKSPAPTTALTLVPTAVTTKSPTPTKTPTIAPTKIPTPIISAATITPQNGLVGWWKLDGNAIDSSSYGNNGTVTGATLTTDRKGQANKAYSFNGSNNYIKTGNGASLNITGTITLSGWVKLNMTSASYQLFGKGRGLGTAGTDKGYAVSWSGTNKQIYWDVYDADSRVVVAGTGAVISDNNWHHIVATWDGTTNANGYKIYIDGVLKTQMGSVAISSIKSSPYPFVVGATSDYQDRPANGLIDDVRVYNRALSPTEITALYKSY